MGKSSFCSWTPSDRYCHSILCSEHTCDPGLKPLENESKNKLEVQPSKLLRIWIFGAVTIVGTMEENYSPGRHSETNLKLVTKLFEAASWFCRTRDDICTDAWIAVANGFIACICSYNVNACGLYHLCRMNRLQLSIGEWLRDHEETILVRLSQLVEVFSFMCFSRINFQKNYCGFFVYLFFPR